MKDLRYDVVYSTQYTLHCSHSSVEDQRKGTLGSTETVEVAKYEKYDDLPTTKEKINFYI